MSTQIKQNTSRHRSWPVAFALGLGLFSAWPATAEDQTDARLTLETRGRIEKPGADGKIEQVTGTAQWDPKATAVIICDMWDDHTCKSAAARVAEMAPAVNRFAEVAREKGMLIIHAPSGKTSFYENTPQRKRAQEAPQSKAPVKIQWNYWDDEREGKPLAFIKSGACGDVTPCPGWYDDEDGLRKWTKGGKIPWTRQIDTIDIAGPDVISDNGQEIYNVMEDRGIDNVILVGVHTNLCVSGRPFGLRQMTYFGKNTVLCRDLTDSLFQPVDPAYDHFRGTEAVVEHIEQTICPSILSTAITGEKAFRFAADQTARRDD